jgi:hypothetical protein
MMKKYTSQSIKFLTNPQLQRKNLTDFKLQLKVKKKYMKKYAKFLN